MFCTRNTRQIGSILLLKFSGQSRSSQTLFTCLSFSNLDGLPLLRTHKRDFLACLSIQIVPLPIFLKLYRKCSFQFLLRSMQDWCSPGSCDASSPRLALPHHISSLGGTMKILLDLPHLSLFALFQSLMFYFPKDTQWANSSSLSCH